MTKALTVDDLVPGTIVTWEWPESLASEAHKRGVRPIGRVVTHEDIRFMSSITKVGIQIEDDPLWIFDPVQVIAKGAKLFEIEDTNRPSVEDVESTVIMAAFKP